MKKKKERDSWERREKRGQEWEKSVTFNFQNMAGWSYKDLQVWAKSVDFVEDLYKILWNFPKTEQFWLVDQMKRASVSIPSNIAEGYSRWTTKNCLQFLRIAKWSASEIETQLLIAKRLGFLIESDYLRLDNNIQEISKMLMGLIKSLQLKES